MTCAWQTYPGAPEAGSVICELEAVASQGCISVEIDGFPIIVLRNEFGVRAFVNACPHQFLPLDHRAPNVLSADKTKLICTNHDAVFDADTGQGLGGYGKGCELDIIPVAVNSRDEIYIEPQEL